MKSKMNSGILFAVLAAALYAISTPFSKLLLAKVGTSMLAAFLYLGAGAGMLIVHCVQKAIHAPQNELRLTKADLPYVAGMIVLDIAAPICLMVGLSTASAANVSLLNNFEIVATSVIALAVFHETISKRLWLAIAFITAASILLSINGTGSFSFSVGSLFVILACVCWGFENNCTRKLSGKDPLEIVIIKGFFSGTGSLVIALLSGERFAGAVYLLLALALGFVAYGLSIFFYIRAQRLLGAAKTSAFYAITPFFAAALSLLIFRETPSVIFIAALTTMILGAYLAATDGRAKPKDGAA